MSLVLSRKVAMLEVDVATLKDQVALLTKIVDGMIAIQAKPVVQPAKPPDLRTREGREWKNATS